MGLLLKAFYVFITSVRIALFPSLMSVVARGGVVYGFYMEQSSVDFGYISPLKSKHSPQGSGLILCSCYSKHNCNCPSSDRSSQGLSLILRRSHTGTVWFYTSTSNKRAARPKLYTKSLTRDLKRMYSRLTLVRIYINL